MISISELSSSARWNVRIFWRRGQEAITTPSPTGFGWTVRAVEPDANIDHLLAEGWRVVVDDPDEAEED